MASVTVQSLGSDGCDGCDGLIELNKKKVEKKSGRWKKQEKFFLETEEKLPVFPSHPSQQQPQNHVSQEVQPIIKPSQIPSQSVKSITDGGGGRFDPIQETGLRYWDKLTTQHRWKSFKCPRRGSWEVMCHDRVVKGDHDSEIGDENRSANNRSASTLTS